MKLDNYYRMDNMAYTKMPYGKYKDTPFCELDWGYLGWMIDNLKPETDMYQSAQQEILRRMDTEIPEILTAGSIMNKLKRQGSDPVKEFLKSRK